MVKTLTAFTTEIDEAALAVSEILAQLDLDNNLFTNSVGIISCYDEFIESGVVKALCEALPFDTVGCTTMGNATAHEMGHLMLCLTVITSDDISFTTIFTSSLEDEQERPLQEAYEKALAQLGEPPSLMFTFAPLINHVGGEILVKILDAISGKVPNFGTVAMDHNIDYHEAKTIWNGETSRTSLAMVLVKGDLQPKFYIASISEEKVQKQKAIITSSDKNVLKQVNGMPIVDYLETLGITKDNGLDSTVTIPFVIDYNDGTKSLARAIYMLSPEGYAVCGGDMPVDSTLSIGSIDYDDVVHTTAEIMGRVKESGCNNGLLIYTCLTRILVLGTDSFAEMEKVQETLDGQIPYHLLYSGGEICPVYDEDGTPVNRFHNMTLIACVF